MKKFDLNKYVTQKIIRLSKNENKTFSAIYEFMFSEPEQIMFEYTNGNRILKISYGECKRRTESCAYSLKETLADVEKGSMVGLYAQNSPEWTQCFFAILKCGFRPVLLNTRLEKLRLEAMIETYSIKAVISDSESFSCPTFAVSSLDYSGKCKREVNDWANEILVMSSGTTMMPKLCAYNGENFFYQLCDSANIIRECKQLGGFYDGALKQLMFLPLYHIFGLSAMFMWFAFFTRTFVLLKDQSPETLLYTIRKHKVTHIFAVPLFWNTVYKTFMYRLHQKDSATVEKFTKGLAIVKKTKNTFLARTLMKTVRDNIFGESIQFLISGGSAIPKEVLEFFNSIGYHLANGYGMSEIGITSVELSSSFSRLTDGAVGKPFTHIKYAINESGELIVKGPSMASAVYKNGKLEELEDGWYNTHDMAKCVNGRYFILGRQDDMIVCADGENLNPEWTEKQMKLDGCENFCITLINEVPTLVIQLKKYTSTKRRDEIKEKAYAELARVGVGAEIQNILFTSNELIGKSDFKLNRSRVASLEFIDESVDDMKLGDADEITTRVREMFKKALGREEAFPDNAHFFFDLKGSSLDYFSLVSQIRSEFNIQLSQNEGGSLYTVEEFSEYIKNKI